MSDDTNENKTETVVTNDLEPVPGVVKEDPIGTNIQADKSTTTDGNTVFVERDGDNIPGLTPVSAKTAAAMDEGFGEDPDPLDGSDAEADGGDDEEA